MGAGEFDYPASPGKPPLRSEALYRIHGLGNERLGLIPKRLLGQGGFADQLRQAA